MKRKKGIALLGSTGSIGGNTLAVISALPDCFEVISLSTNANIDLLEKQIRHFSPKSVAVADLSAAYQLRRRLHKKINLFAGEWGIEKLVDDERVDLVVLALSGSCALSPLFKAIDAGKTIAMANKEALVMAGSLVKARAKQRGARIIPIDSEQSAIWQCLESADRKSLRRIYLTASGGPLRKISQGRFKKITLREVLQHPRWKMGKKISVDSATLMNKGLELIETMWLFDVDISKISVIIHPEAIIHSMVEFVDGSVLAQLSCTDMRIPIQYALTYPQRFNSNLEKLDFIKIRNLSFFRPDLGKFPCLSLAYRAARVNGTMPCVLNTANEIAVDAFLRKRIAFVAIPQLIEQTMARHKVIARPDLSEIFRTQAWAEKQTKDLISRLN